MKNLSIPEFRKILQEETDRLLQQMAVNGFWSGDDQRYLLYCPTTWDINNGECETWAEAVAERVPDTEIIWLDAVPDWAGQYVVDNEIKISDIFELPAHCVIFYRKKYYDAECLDGVSDWTQLPIVQNKGQSREDVLKQRGDTTMSENLIWAAREEIDKTEGKGGSRAFAYFKKKEDAQQAAKNKGVWGQDGEVEPIYVHSSLAEWQAHINQELRQRALAKLTEEEKRALGV